MKETLRKGGYFVLDARWKMRIELKTREGLTREGLNTGMGFGVYLHPIPTKEEIHDLSNIWSRSVKWTVSFLIKTRGLVICRWTVVFLL